jgi:hypothetical protein
MAWTAEDRRAYAPAMQELVRRGMIVRLARTMDAQNPRQPRARRRWTGFLERRAARRQRRNR